MTYKLMIVESPAKLRKIVSLLGKGWKVEASLGCLRDLPRNALGIDVDDGSFRVHYQIMDGKLNVVKRLKKAIDGASAVYLAFDPDWDGEAAAWHVLALCKDESEGKRIYRVTFDALTKEAVSAAIANPRDLDHNVVEAQKTRRAMDRLVNYTISPLTSKLLGIHGLVIGRAQSPCLRLIVEREREIRTFTPSRYWTLDAIFQANADSNTFAARLWVAIRHGMDTAKPSERLTHEQAQQLMRGLTGVKFWVEKVIEAKEQVSPPLPFTTPSLLQTAHKTLGLSAVRAIELARKLYDNGLITYPYTANATVTPTAQETTRAYAAATYGQSYVSNRPLVANSAASRTQEAIRPVDIARLPGTLGDDIDGDGAALYALIWKRFAASQMAEAQYETTRVRVLAGKNLGRQPYPLEFSTQSRLPVFDGFEKVYQEPRDEDEIGRNALPKLSDGQPLDFCEWLLTDHATQAPNRYTEASLIEDLARRGIGRPTTYASIVGSLKDTGYVHLEKSELVPTDTAFAVYDLLLDRFGPLVTDDFAAQMEQSLDQVATGTLSQEAALQNLWGTLLPLLQNVGTVLDTRAKERLSAIPIGEPCPKCGHELVQRFGTHGPFIGCSNYPRCQYSRGGSRPLRVVDKATSAQGGGKARR